MKPVKQIVFNEQEFLEAEIDIRQITPNPYFDLGSIEHDNVRYWTKAIRSRGVSWRTEVRRTPSGVYENINQHERYFAMYYSDVGKIRVKIYTITEQPDIYGENDLQMQKLSIT
jgi:hypothetical protein